MPKRKTTEEFIADAHKVHGNKYDYSMVVYQGSEKKVTIICPEHGPFSQTPHSHLFGQGCPICGRIKCNEARRNGIDEFLRKAYEVHGDRYQYNKVILKNWHDKVTITCREHGDFQQTPDNHINQKQGCPKCARRLVGQKSTKNQAWFLERAYEVHGEKYDYSRSVYERATKKLTIICHRIDDGGHEHGPFEMTPNDHINKRYGCPICGHPKHTTEWWKEEARKEHGDEYDYSKAVYKNNKEPVTIICREHGEFQMLPMYHLNGGICPKCNGRNLTTAEFVALANVVHHGEYNYDKVEYINKTTEVCITCHKHGDFMQTPYRHLQGSGCIQCHIESRTTDLDSFIARANEVHGNKYDYSKAVYVNSKTKICIICPDHGVFWATPNNHLSGSGCPECAGNLKKDTEQFKEESRIIHGNKYDYSKVEYKSRKEKVCIICPEHGEFWQTPNSHLNGAGCPACSGLKPITVDRFKERSAFVHNNKYDYSKVSFSSVNEKVCIICPEHGEFWQSASLHMHGYNCPKCSGKYMDTAFFKEKASIVHNGKYNYSKVVFKGAFEKVTITCPIHGDFNQVASYHLAGNGCPKCSESQLEKDLRAVLKNSHIKFVSQKSFDWLVFEGKMYLDFFLPDYGVAIECQGIQHFEPIEIFGGEDGFERTKLRDEAKKMLCEEHGIKVLYFSNLGIEYPYPVIENPTLLLQAINDPNGTDPSRWKDPQLPLVFD